MKRILIITFGLLAFQACQSENKAPQPTELEKEINEIPKEFNPVFKDVDSLGAFDNTDFAPTLESSINKKHNSIYSATILFAWDEIRKEIKDSMTHFTSSELELINKSKSYIGVLNKNEYKTNVTVNEDTIFAEAYFQKSLPFSSPLNKHKTPFLFKKDSVASFGFHVYGHKSFRAIINFYNCDEDFSITLKPKDRDHEIILIKTNKNQSSLSQYIDYLNSESEEFKNNINSENEWRHNLVKDDDVKIPILNFNIEHNFESIENSLFNTNDILYKVLTFYQQNAFILNENGAEVESFAVEEVVEECVAEIGAEIPTPKKMHFNDDFVIFLKRKDGEFPYFGLYITNDELMVKFDDQSKD